MNILIADDQVLFRDMLRSLLEQESDLHLVGCVGSGREALAACTAQPVDILLMDIRMPDMYGVSAALKLRAAAPKVRILLLTAFADRDLTDLSGAGNIHAVLLKDLHANDLLRAIRLCANGLYVADQAGLPALARAVCPEHVSAKVQAHPSSSAFSPLDLQILGCLIRGMSNREIAEAVNYSEGTVKSRISRLLSESDLKDRTQLALFALKHHLV